MGCSPSTLSARRGRRRRGQSRGRRGQPPESRRRRDHPEQAASQARAESPSQRLEEVVADVYAPPAPRARQRSSHVASRSLGGPDQPASAREDAVAVGGRLLHSVCASFDSVLSEVENVLKKERNESIQESHPSRRRAKERHSREKREFMQTTSNTTKLTPPQESGGNATRREKRDGKLEASQSEKWKRKGRTRGPLSQESQEEIQDGSQMFSTKLLRDIIIVKLLLDTTIAELVKAKNIRAVESMKSVSLSKSASESAQDTDEAWQRVAVQCLDTDSGVESVTAEDKQVPCVDDPRGHGECAILAFSPAR